MKPGHGEKYSRRKEALLVALLQEPNLEKAAKKARVSPNTAWRWLQIPEFAEDYRKAKREAVSQAVGALQRASSEAVETLQEIMRDREAASMARLNAAKCILEMSMNALEAEEIIARLERLEVASQDF
jgi:hypothetical protein